MVLARALCPWSGSDRCVIVIHDHERCAVCAYLDQKQQSSGLKRLVKSNIKTITYLSDINDPEIHGVSLKHHNLKLLQHF